MSFVEKSVASKSKSAVTFEKSVKVDLYASCIKYDVCEQICYGHLM